MVRSTTADQPPPELLVKAARLRKAYADAEAFWPRRWKRQPNPTVPLAPDELEDFEQLRRECEAAEQDFQEASDRHLGYIRPLVLGGAWDGHRIVLRYTGQCVGHREHLPHGTYEFDKIDGDLVLRLVTP